MKSGYLTNVTICDTLTGEGSEKGRGGEGMKTATLEEQTREEAENVLYHIECEDYATALEFANDLCAMLRRLADK